jgi:hypothetical protein
MPRIPYHVLDEMRESPEFKELQREFTETPEYQKAAKRLEDLGSLMTIAILMSQELQEFIDEAIASSGDESALPATQELLADWEKAFKVAFDND